MIIFYPKNITVWFLNAAKHLAVRKNVKSADLDQTALKEQSDLGLHCLHMHSFLDMTDQ